MAAIIPPRAPKTIPIACERYGKDASLIRRTPFAAPSIEQDKSPKLAALSIRDTLQIEPFPAKAGLSSLPWRPDRAPPGHRSMEGLTNSGAKLPDLLRK
jgi:hypothetical protein